MSYGHYLLAYSEMSVRDWERSDFTQKHTDICCLGAALLAGTTSPIDRELVAQELGSDVLYVNSLDAVCDRDLLLEFLCNRLILS